MAARSAVGPAFSSQKSFRYTVTLTCHPGFANPALGTSPTSWPTAIARALGDDTAVLIAYGFMVNLTKLDFGRLMGIYIVLFFLVAQSVSVLIFKEKMPIGVIVGGSLVVSGGVLMTLWH